MTLDMFSSTSTSQYNPGPGAYNVDSYRSIGGPLSLKYRFNATDRPMNRASKTLTSEVNYMPLTSTLTNKGKTIAPRYPEIQPKSNTLGPSYLPDPGEGFRRSVRIKSRYPDRDMSMYPGPGSYDPRDWPKTQPPPMGPRPDIVLCDVPASPGPAAYEVPRNLGDNALKFSIRPITAPGTGNDEDPGFTYNNPRNLGEDAPRYTLSRAERRREYESEVPGPGTYEPENKAREKKIAPAIHPVIVNTIGEREDIPYENTRRFPDLSKGKTIHRKCGRGSGGYWDIDDSVPGPDWMPDSTIERRNITIRNRIPERSAGHGTPGPGTYNVMTYANASRKSEPAFTMKGPSDRDYWLPTQKEGPGPGQYKIEGGNGLPMWTIGERSIQRARELRAKTSLSQMSRRAETTTHSRRTALQ